MGAKAPPTDYIPRKIMAQAKSNAWYGWRPDKPDARDRLYPAIACPPKRLPRRVDLRAHCPPVENQRSIGSCTATALVGNLEFLAKKAGRRIQHLSRLFLYYNARVFENTADADEGATIRHGVKSLVKIGVCTERLWPYKVRRFAHRPPDECYAQAAMHQVRSYHRIRGLDQMRQCLAEGYPFVFGLNIYESFESATIIHTGVLHLPRHGEKDCGGHSVCAVGYNDETRRLLVRNSWGAAWGRAGHFTVPYDYVANPKLAEDFWTIRAFEHV